MGEAPRLAPDAARDLACVLDALVPPSADGRLPGAGELGLVAAIEQAMARSSDLVPALEAGLAALAEAARRRGAAHFAALAPDARAAALAEIQPSQPAFVPGLIFHTYVAYYLHERVVLALGLEARPPHPLGYELEPGDLSSLEKVRRRGRLYREV